MTLTIELSARETQTLTEQASQLKLAPEEVAHRLLAQALEAQPKDNLDQLTEELFQRRSSAYLKLAEGAP